MAELGLRQFLTVATSDNTTSNNGTSDNATSDTSWHINVWFFLELLDCFFDLNLYLPEDFTVFPYEPPSHILSLSFFYLEITKILACVSLKGMCQKFYDPNFFRQSAQFGPLDKQVMVFRIQFWISEWFDNKVSKILTPLCQLIVCLRVNRNLKIF